MLLTGRSQIDFELLIKVEEIIIIIRRRDLNELLTDVVCDVLWTSEVMMLLVLECGKEGNREFLIL